MKDDEKLGIPGNQPYSAAQELRKPTIGGIAYVLNYVRTKNYDMRIGTGNAYGGQAQDPVAFETKIQQGHFFAWDYISAAEIVGDDRVTPNATFAKAKIAMHDVLSLLKANASRKI